MLRNLILTVFTFTISTSLLAQLEPYRGKADTPSNQGLTNQENIKSNTSADTIPLKDAFTATSAVLTNDSLQRFLQLADSLEVNSDGLEGFRVQLFSNSGPKAKAEAFKEQGEFIQLYPDIPSYTKWSSPNWVLRAGDFRNRLEARQFLDEIKSAYPAAFIVNDGVKSKFGD